VLIKHQAMKANRKVEIFSTPSQLEASCSSMKRPVYHLGKKSRWQLCWRLYKRWRKINSVHPPA
jgi:hypothetical protein